MRLSMWLSVPIVAAVVGAGVLSAQQPRNFKARLAPVPIDVSMQATIAGTGSVSAVLTGTRLAMTGSFDGLRSPATIAQLHKGPIKGVRGPNIFDLTVTRTEPSAGTLSGTIELTPLQVADLEKGRLYIQVHSEKAPDGNLWGWIVPQEVRRRSAPSRWPRRRSPRRSQSCWSRASSRPPRRSRPTRRRPGARCIRRAAPAVICRTWSAATKRRSWLATTS